MDYGGESIAIGGTATQSAERPIDSIDSIDSIDFAVCLQIIQGEQKHVRMSLCHVVFLVFRDESLQDWRTTSHRLAASPTSWTILSMPFATSSLCVLDV